MLYCIVWQNIEAKILSIFTPKKFCLNTYFLIMFTNSSIKISFSCFLIYQIFRLFIVIKYHTSLSLPHYHTNLCNKILCLLIVLYNFTWNQFARANFAPIRWYLIMIMIPVSYIYKFILINIRVYKCSVYTSELLINTIIQQSTREKYLLPTHNRY